MSLSRMRELETEAERHLTPSGDGHLVWRRWVSEKIGAQSVVLLHGGSGSWTHWIKNIRALQTQYDVWTIDIPGLGDSAMPHPPLVPQSCADAVVQGYRELFPAGSKTKMVCFSFGCHVGTLAAGELNDRIEGMVIIGTAALGLPRSPHMRPFPKERNTMTDAERREVHRGVLEILMISQPAHIDDEAIELQALNIEKARFRSREFAGSADVRDGLAKVDRLIGTIWGENDIVAYPSVETCIEILRTHHPELKQRIISNAGHWVMYEQAEAFNSALLEMLQD